MIANVASTQILVDESVVKKRPKSPSAYGLNDVNYAKKTVVNNNNNNTSKDARSKLNSPTSRDQTKLQEFYAGKNVLITGATGFMGKVLIEKLLRTCPDVNKIYMLVRSKRGKSQEERIDHLTNSACFSLLKSQQPNFKEKMVAVAGDMNIENLGLSNQDLDFLAHEVNIIFHVAATVRFDEQLNVAIRQNVRATRDLLKICRTFTKLKSLIHVSTAYANCPSKDINECFYDPPLDCDKAIEMAETMQSDEMDKMTTELLGPWPNTYSFTKALAEDIVNKHSGDLPVGVFRPSIVICTKREPVPGWIDNMYGPGGMFASYTCGVLRTAQGHYDTTANCVPCDLAINGLLAAAWDVAENWKEKDEIPIYNFVSSANNETTWKTYVNTYMHHMADTPYSRALWYPMVIPASNPITVFVLRLLLHFIPGLIMDLFILLSGSKPRMLQLYLKVHKYSDVVIYFVSRRWNFEEKNVVNLWNKLEKKDKELFDFDMRALDWGDYYKDTFMGLRQYLLRDSPDTIPAARIRMRRLKYLHETTKVLLVCLFLYAISSIFL